MPLVNLSGSSTASSTTSTFTMSVSVGYCGLELTINLHPGHLVWIVCTQLFIVFAAQIGINAGREDGHKS